MLEPLRPSRVSGALLLASLVAGLAAPLPVTAAAAGEPAAPPLFSGVLLNPAGAALPGAQIIVGVEESVTAPYEGDKVTPIAAGTTDARGGFALEGDLDVPATYNPDGSVRLELTIVAGALARHYNVNAVPPTVATPAWTFGETPDAGVLPQSAAATVADRARTPLSGLQISFRSEDAGIADGITAPGEDTVGLLVEEVIPQPVGEHPTDPVVDSGVETVASSNPCNTSAPTEYYWENMDDYRFRHVPAQRMTTWNRSTMDYRVECKP